MPEALRIGVNALYLIPGGVGGTEIYLRNLMAALALVDRANHYFVFTNRETGADLAPGAPNFHVVPQHVRASVRPARLLWEQTLLPWQARRQRLDVLFNPGFTSPFLAPCPQVTVFHDLQHKRHPEYFRWFDLPFWQFFLYWSAKHSKYIVAVSEATRDDLQKFYGLPGASLRVVQHGVEEAFFEVGRRRQESELRPYILCVSTLHPHKNLDRLVRAFRQVHQRWPEFRLVIAGMHGFQTSAIEKTIIECGMGAHVHITGWIPREELLDLYHRAFAFVYPSTFEGFGMPVLEALASAIPSAVSNIEPIRSVAGPAALQFDPFSEEAIAEALRQVVEDKQLRARLVRAGPQQASRFSWKTAAEQTLRILELAARG
ncbi:MAG: glycosyltransferase family 4 protein [Bryobacteraceae bacterium]|nr:glycosyltransferase family 4 protein [Bryobacteraceae bacterium]MDW8379176.1 glycosyltransferase family 1 protein [Bryobacterales bacterium]